MKVCLGVSALASHTLQASSLSLALFVEEHLKADRHLLSPPSLLVCHSQAPPPTCSTHTPTRRHSINHVITLHIRQKIPIHDLMKRNILRSNFLCFQWWLERLGEKIVLTSTLLAHCTADVGAWEAATKYKLDDAPSTSSAKLGKHLMDWAKVIKSLKGHTRSRAQADVPSHPIR